MMIIILSETNPNCNPNPKPKQMNSGMIFDQQQFYDMTLKASYVLQFIN